MNTQPAREASSPPVSHPTSAPQVRTLLLTDLCESTTLVERLGDSLAAALFREHDRLVLELQQRWRGRLIDRSDGLLLLFERPIDGLGFALDYMRGLHELGQSRKLKLQARAGLHVGEVLTWENTDEAVRAGAKSLEVEGLAKPLAARLMSLARPGQILLSAVAEPMSHRAASELGERGQHLVWKSYGRWRFKGVPNAQEIHEVGEPGLAALRMPKHTPKAWRDIPLWRRPAALAAEVLLIAGLGTGAWFLTRSPPAIAFSERDWVVVGDLRNLTGQPVLDESLEQAFRISLEQSRYVNVLSDLKVRDTLALMRRKPDDPLDRAIASEVATRDGARAVILPTVAEVGGRLRVSAEVIDPHTQTTVYAQSADGAGVASALSSIDTVTDGLRAKLGEALQSIDRNSVALPNVSTDNLDALKAYAVGEQHKAAGASEEAISFLERAVVLDPSFALAMVRIARLKESLGDLPAGQRYYERAAKLRGRLSPREALMLDAEFAARGPVDIALQRWRELIALYPDTAVAHFRLAQDGMSYANRYKDSLAHVRSAITPQSSYHRSGSYLEGMLLLGLERYHESVKAFQTALQGGYKGHVLFHAYAYAAQRDYAKAQSLIATRPSSGVASAELDLTAYRMLLAIDQGYWKDAQKNAQAGLNGALEIDSAIAEAEWRNRVLAVDVLVGESRHADLSARLSKEISRLRGDAAQLDSIYPRISTHLLLAAGYIGARADSGPVVQQALAAVSPSSVDGYPLLRQMREVLAAESHRLRGKPDRAIALLLPLARSDETIIPVHSALLRAAISADQTKLALEQARWISAHRGRAFVEHGVDFLPTPFNIADTTVAHLNTAELLEQLGDANGARQELTAFRIAWPSSRTPKTVSQSVDALSSRL